MVRPARARATWVALLVPALSSVVLAASGAAAHPSPGAPGAAPPPTDGTIAQVDPGLRTTGRGAVRVVVQTAGGAGGAQAQDEVRRLGGRVTRDLPLIDGFAATLPAVAVSRLAQHGGVRVLSADRPVQVQGGPTTDGDSPVAPRVVRAPEAWSDGHTGEGVTVALVDSGVAAVPDLDGRMVPVQDDSTGRVAPCHDLSGEGHCGDSYGHGTFMAGLIAGDGARAGGRPTGAAPGASVLSVKVAGASGAADVSTVLAAVQWVVSFRDRYDIRVLNLSLGTDSTQSWKDDPLNYAVERAWDAGILVVVAAANTGPAAGTIAKPADDPWVVTVGAVDDRGTVGHGDDTVPDFSSRGPTSEGVAKPDVVAPGAHVRSLRAEGSTLDETFPPADPTSPYRTGSGTSMAAAMVSGVAAVVLDAHPALTPDRLKHALRSGARKVASDDPSTVGSGLVDAHATASAPASGAANVGLERSTGRGSLSASRGSLVMRADDPLGTLLTDRQTAQLLLWDPLSYTTGSWTPTTWYTSVHGTLGWNSAYWAGAALDGQNWTGQNWTGQNWTGQNWTGSSWYGEHEEESSYGRAGEGSASYGAWD